MAIFKEVDGRAFDTNEQWADAMWRENGIQVSGNEYLVPGSNGAMHRVTFCGCTDDGYGHTWNCSCPSAKFHGGTCKHIDLVSSITNYINDMCGYE